MPVPAAALALLAAVAVLLAATAADAQSVAGLNSQIRALRNQISTLNNNVAGLRTQLGDLEKEVHTGAAPRGAAPDASPDAAPDAAPASKLAERNRGRLVEIETDIDEVKEWQRRVTGRFEELENMMRRVEGRIERLVADVDFRLGTLERRLERPPAAANDARAGDAPAPAPAPATQSDAGIAPGQDGGYQPSGAPRDLGTIPADWAPGDAPPPGQTPRERYDGAFALLEASRYEEANEALTRFIAANPTHALVENAAYWRAESLYARKMYLEAARSYASNLQQFPEGRKAPDNMVKLGMALLKLGRGEEACRTFAQLDQAFSDPPLRIRRAAQQGRQQASCP